jgi:transposase-like protein
MSRRPRRNHSPTFKAKVAIDALADGKTIAEIAHKHDVHPNQVTEWRRQLMERAAGVFRAAAAPETAPHAFPLPAFAAVSARAVFMGRYKVLGRLAKG